MPAAATNTPCLQAVSSRASPAVCQRQDGEGNRLRLSPFDGQSHDDSKKRQCATRALGTRIGSHPDHLPFFVRGGTDRVAPLRCDMHMAGAQDRKPPQSTMIPGTPARRANSTTLSRPEGETASTDGMSCRSMARGVAAGKRRAWPLSVKDQSDRYGRQGTPAAADKSPRSGRAIVQIGGMLGRHIAEGHRRTDAGPGPRIDAAHR